MARSQAKRPARIRVVVADDHPLMRTGVVSVLAQDPLLEVVGEARDGEEAVLLVQQLQPQVALIDVAMPGMGGLEATRVLRDCCPTTSVLILTTTTQRQCCAMPSKLVPPATC